ncbi:hypothetical protein BKA69DRAFT_291936 [Paraphysoderma sedebokerense]|nr:hypothetical protein BKA69DRAFT_291936 [Paraphysoderma sedebokerense]
MSNTEQVAKLEARLGQLELLSAQRHSELKETLAQQDIQLEERFNQLALRLEERIAQIDSRCEVRMAQMVNAISDDSGVQNSPKELPLTTPASSPSSSSSKLNVVGRLSGLAFTITSKSLLRTFFPSACYGLLSLKHQVHARIQYSRFLDMFLAYVALDLGLTLYDTVSVFSPFHIHCVWTPFT